MTQKSVGKLGANGTGKVFVFGVDDDYKPHAAWFPKAQGEAARAAAKQLRLNAIEVDNGTAADLVTKVPAGRIHQTGPAWCLRFPQICTKRSLPPSTPEAKPAGRRTTRW